MSHITLILTRQPTIEFAWGKKSGRWGRMAVVKGPKIKSAKFLTSEAGVVPDNVFGASTINAGVKVAQAVVGQANMQVAALQANPQSKTTSIYFANKFLGLVTDGNGDIERVTEFDSMERFRADNNKTQFYMQIRPRPDSAYRLTMFLSSTVAKLNKTGQCLRVHGHGYKQQGTNNDAGILVHEAPNISWLIGCISPRETNNRVQSSNRESSRKAIEFIFTEMGGFSVGREASLIVLDW